MKIAKSQAKILFSALDEWNNTGLLDDNMTVLLKNDIEILNFDWKKLARYSFWVSLICIVIAINAILSDRYLRELLEYIFNAPYLLKFITLSTLSGIIYFIGFKRQQQKPEKIFSNGAILFLGVLTTACAIYQLGKAFDSGSGHFSILLLLSFIVYAILGYFSKSNLIWCFALISLGSWMGAETGYMSGWGAYYLGMNYPLRFILFGGILTFSALALEENKKFNHFTQVTLVIGLLYSFIAMWLLSIFGNYAPEDYYLKSIKPIELFHWSLLFALMSGAAIYHGLKQDNSITKGFGVTFLFINLYTRFFEYFWNTTHKAVFFTILGISFWWLGSKAEKIWNLTAKK